MKLENIETSKIIQVTWVVLLVIGIMVIFSRCSIYRIHSAVTNPKTMTVILTTEYTRDQYKKSEYEMKCKINPNCKYNVKKMSWIEYRRVR